MVLAHQAFVSHKMSIFTSTSLCTNWEFKQVDAVGVPEPSDAFLQVSQFPTNIHLDLLHHNLIPDPFIGLNEYEVQWVGEQKWLYRTTFEASAALANEKTVLQFDGLDTFALVSLNGIQILESENMHRTFRVDVSGTVKEGANALEILFDSAIIRGKQVMQERDFKPAGFTSSTDKSRLLVRKAQYHYSWNWGQLLVERTILFETNSMQVPNSPPVGRGVRFTSNDTRVVFQTSGPRRIFPLPARLQLYPYLPTWKEIVTVFL